MNDFKTLFPWKKVKASWYVLGVLLVVWALKNYFGLVVPGFSEFAFQRYPVIVWWTPFTPYKRIAKSCSKGSCLFVHSRQAVTDPLTEAVLFYGTDFRWTDLPLPRNFDQYWSLLHEESPKNNWGFAYTPAISLFNITATFSRHSTYPLVAQYLESVDELMNPLKYTTAQKSKGDIGLVMYLHSDCSTPSDRDSYAKELMKYVKVDSYGKCLHNKDLPERLRNPVSGLDSDDLLDIIAQYKFILTFENAICEDYITEKFWRSFEAGTVPIYKGSPSVRDWAPSNHSVIVVEDFSSPKELGEYLKSLDANDEEYEKYLGYKKDGITNKQLLEHMQHRDYHVKGNTKPDLVDGFECAVCNKIYERKESGDNFKPVLADHSHYDCQYPRPSIKRRTTNSLSKDTLMFWRQVASLEFYRAKAVAKVISSGGNSDDVQQAYENAGKQLMLDDFKLQAEDLQS